jgi:hypothetical protein
LQRRQYRCRRPNVSTCPDSANEYEANCQDSNGPVIP